MLLSIVVLFAVDRLLDGVSGSGIASGAVLVDGTWGIGVSSKVERRFDCPGLGVELLGKVWTELVDGTDASSISM